MCGPKTVQCEIATRAIKHGLRLSPCRELHPTELGKGELPYCRGLCDLSSILQGSVKLHISFQVLHNRAHSAPALSVHGYALLGILVVVMYRCVLVSTLIHMSGRAMASL